MDARKRKARNRYGLESASTRREMLLRQHADIKCIWLEMCKTNQCVTAFIAINNHHSQSAGSGNRSYWPQPRDTEANADVGNHEGIQQHIRTARGRNTLADGRLPCKALDAQMDRDETVYEAPSGTDSSGRPCATRSHKNKVADLAVDRSMIGSKFE